MCDIHETLSQTQTSVLSKNHTFMASYNTFGFSESREDSCFAERQDNLIAFIVSLLSVKSVIIIYEENNLLTLSNIHDECNNIGSTKVQIFSVSQDNIQTDIQYIFKYVNARVGLTFLLLGSVQMFAITMEIAQLSDYNLDQQGYFTTVHKWIYLDRSGHLCSTQLLANIKGIDNVLCVHEKVNVSVKNTSNMEIFTAMYGHSARYWQGVSFNDCGDVNISSANQMFPNTRLGFNKKQVLIGSLFRPGLIERVNNTYKGINFEIMDFAAKINEFSYELVFARDNHWGDLMENGTWSGVMGQLQKREVDFVTIPMAVTLKRFNAVGFTDFFSIKTSFVGIYKMPKPRSNALELYLLPFNKTVWLLIIVTILVMTGAHALMIHIVFESNRSITHDTHAIPVNTKLRMNMSTGCELYNLLFAVAWMAQSITHGSLQ